MKIRRTLSDWRFLFPRSGFALSGALLILGLAHLASAPASEPFFNNDETRHAMTGSFVRDVFFDFSEFARNPKSYAVRYYLQYPALGLLVWPPLFYGIEGVAMAVFGPTFETGRACVFALAAVALIFVYRLVKLNHSERFAALAVLLTGLSPLVFLYSQRVMLEVPTFAFGMWAIFYFERYLLQFRRSDAIGACLFAAAAALTRYDAVYLLSYFGLRLLLTHNLKLLFKREVILGLILAGMIAAPYYLVAIREYGQTLDSSVKQGTGQSTNIFQNPWSIFFYLGCIPAQVGWGVSVAALFGIGLAFRQRTWLQNRHFHLMLAVYLTFTLIAEKEYRHAIYWIPALAVFALQAIRGIAARTPRAVGFGLAVALVVATAAEGMLQPLRYVWGYGPAAAFVVARGNPELPVLIDGELTGAFIFQMRQHDPQRRWTVLRGDKLFYAVQCDAITAYDEKAKNAADLLEILHRYDPEFIVIEDPQVRDPVPAGELLRAVLRSHPEKFVLVHREKVRSNQAMYDPVWLTIYRKPDRNPERVRTLQLDVLGLGQKLSTPSNGE